MSYVREISLQEIIKGKTKTPIYNILVKLIKSIKVQKLLHFDGFIPEGEELDDYFEFQSKLQGVGESEMGKVEFTYNYAWSPKYPSSLENLLKDNILYLRISINGKRIFSISGKVEFIEGDFLEKRLAGESIACTIKNPSVNIPPEISEEELLFLVKILPKEYVVGALKSSMGEYFKKVEEEKRREVDSLSTFGKWINRIETEYELTSNKPTPLMIIKRIILGT